MSMTQEIGVTAPRPARTGADVVPDFTPELAAELAPLYDKLKRSWRTTT